MGLIENRLIYYFFFFAETQMFMKQGSTANVIGIDSPSFGSPPAELIVYEH